MNPWRGSQPPAKPAAVSVKKPPLRARELPFKVLQSVAEDMAYTWNEGEELPNRVTVRIREN